ncbi:MAG: hypothetical protein LBV34_08195, partial [Nocardiopsaceae bacterium]|nr:hypothetical protein [Nocardiopsaceae bacterium]
EDVDPVEPEADEPNDAARIDDLMRRRATTRRRHARQRVFLAAAACLVLLGGGVAAGVAVGHQPAPSVLALQGKQHSATDPATGVHGIVGLVPFAWGTQVVMDLANVRGPLTCELVAISRSGQRHVIAGWHVPAAGYGVPGHPAHLVLAGATSIMQQDLARIDVDVVGGRKLVSIKF